MLPWPGIPPRPREGTCGNCPKVIRGLGGAQSAPAAGGRAGEYLGPASGSLGLPTAVSHRRLLRRVQAMLTGEAKGQRVFL